MEALSDASKLEVAVGTEFEKMREQSAAEDWIAIVDLAGPCPLAADLRDPERRSELEDLLADALSAVAVEIRTNELSSPVDVDAFRAQPHLLGEALAVIDELEKDERALSRLGPDPLALSMGSEHERIEYLKSLLQGLDEEAVRRLLADEVL